MLGIGRQKKLKIEYLKDMKQFEKCEWRAHPQFKHPSKYSVERVSLRKVNIGRAIAQGLLRKRDINALRTITDDEPEDLMPNFASSEFSRFYDPFATVVDSDKMPVEAMFNGSPIPQSKE